MKEGPADMSELQQLLDRSLAGASEHMRSIIRADRAVPAPDLVQRLTGMRTLALSTVSAAGRPRVSAVDGHLLRGRWVFTTSGSSVKASDMRTTARPTWRAIRSVCSRTGRSSSWILLTRTGPGSRST
jgi:hypothetical protein